MSHPTLDSTASGSSAIQSEALMIQGGGTVTRVFQWLRTIDTLVGLAHRMDKGEARMKDATKTRRTRGAVQVEYAFLLLFVMVPAAAVLLGGGRVVYQTYLITRTALLLSVP
jgi:hypothetical protein